MYLWNVRIKREKIVMNLFLSYIKVRSIHTLPQYLVELPQTISLGSNVSGILPQAFYKFAGILAHSSWQNWWNWVRFVGLAHARLFSAAYKFTMGLRSGPCDRHSNTLTLLSLSHFVTNSKVCFGSVSIWKTHFHLSFNLLADVIRCCFSMST